MSKTALIVEDSKLAALAIKKALETMGYTKIEIVENGELAIQACRNLSPDLVTMDLNMPGINGFEAIEQILSTNSTLNIIVVTERNLTDEDRQKLSKAKAIVLKPITVEKLKSAIESL